MPNCTLPLREALNDSTSSGRFVDTKIILYSRRDSSGAITKPKVLYTNSHVLKSVPYFSDLLSGLYSESEPKDFSEPIDEDEEAENYGYYSDSDLEDDEDAANTTGKASKKAATLKSNSLDSSHLPADDKKPAPVYGEWDEPFKKGTVIRIHDVAFITFQAFLMYLYTDQIKFAPYGSEENSRSRSNEIVSSSEDSIPRPSPKSIYRLADMYDLPALKRLASDDIKSGLELCDTVEEAFSEFSSRYEVIRAMQVNHLVLVLSRADENSAKILCERIDEKLDCYANGDLDHAADAITHMWKLSKVGRPSPLGQSSPPSRPSRVPPHRPSPSRPSPRRRSPPSPPTPDSPDEVPRTGFGFICLASLLNIPPSNPENWMRVEAALIKSIRKGIFIDRRYWTRHSKSTSVLRPVYTSSIVTRGKLLRIDGLVKICRGKECFEIGEVSEDSDCESIPEPAAASLPDENEGEEPEPLPLLTVGSFASWRSLFFYMCTGIIQFAQLKSQGADARARHVQEQTMPDKPPPCSPKVIYSLADALWILPLRDRAFRDIQSKITSENVVAELFSGYASRQGKIAGMECGLLYEKFDNETTTAKGVELIESMMGGNSAHRSGALKLGFRQGLLGSVFLRCPRSSCDLRDNPTPYRFLGPSVKCPREHPKNPYLECSGCGASRTDSSHTSCQGCKKRFR